MKKAKEYTGWSFRKRPFSAAQFKRSALKKSRMSYAAYLKEYARQYKNRRLRKYL